MTSLRAANSRSTALLRIASVAIVALMAVIAVSGCVREDDLTDQQRAFSLDKQLMCPVCDGQTIDESHAQIAQDMKLSVREQIAEGKSNQEIRDYFVARYGESVLASPEASGFNLLVWIMPAIIGGGGALAVFWVLKNMRKKSAEAAAEAPVTVADRQLEKYLERVDAEIGYRHEASTATEPGRESGKS